MILSRILILILLVVNVGCILTRTQIKNKEEKKEISNKLTSLQKESADDQAKFQEMEYQVRDLVGRSEVIEKNLQEEIIKNNVSSKASAEKLKIYEEAILKVEKELATAKNDVSELKGIILGLAKEIEALKKKKEAKKAKAVKIPTGNFKSSEYYFAKKNWKKAIKGYQKYRELNPKGKRYKVSTYKIGVCFEELGLKNEAKLFYDEVVEKYPTSRESKKAQVRLKKLK